MTTSTKPAATHNVTPYLCVHDAAGAIEFYKRAFGATETMRLAEPSGKIGHAEIVLAGSSIMLADEYPDHGALSPKSIGGSPVTLHVYTDDVDALFTRAAAAGAKVTRPVSDQFYGDRSGQLEDPYGHVWMFSTHKEDVSAEEMQKRFDAMLTEEGSGEAAAREHAAKPVRPIPEGFHTVTPYLIVGSVDKLIEFLKAAFGAQELLRMPGGGGGVHAEVRIGDSIVMMGEGAGASHEYNAMIYLYMNDVDAVYKRAMAAGATSVSEPADQPYGDRTAAVKDASGNDWYIATHIKDVAM